MLRLQRDRCSEIRLPARHRLTGQSVYEVEAHVVKACASRRRRGTRGLRGGVNASERAQFAVVKRLCAERNAVEASAAQQPQRAGVLRTVGIRLEGDLRIAGERIVRPNRFKQLREPPCTKQARRAAAEVDGIDRVRRSARCALRKLPLQRGAVGVHLLLAARKGVEVAVNALAFTKRDMKIKSERTGV